MWKKISFYSLPKNRPLEAVTHAQLPTGLIFENFVRVFFASRNHNNTSSVYYVDMFLNDKKVDFSSISEYPVLIPGDIGTFDEHGVYPSSVVMYNNKYFMYYIGWNKGIEAPLFYTSIGLAVSEDGQSFAKLSSAPIMSRSEHDPCLVTSPNVYIEKGLWRMTYVSGIKWTRALDGHLQSHYHIKYAESQDGVNWKRDGLVAIDFQKGETNIARPSVIRDQNGNYKMWFSYVHSEIGKYRIGFAKSKDGFFWERTDDAEQTNIDCSQAKEMICYPFVFFFKNNMYILYNGDNYGQKGFGIALWRE